MDGINGITAVYAAVFFGSLALIPLAEHTHRYITIAVIPGMLAAILAFAWFNFRKKALCFAGDVGSISLALIMAWAFLTYWQGHSTLYLLLFPALYAVDSVMTIAIRLYRRENIFQAHRSHLYEILANEASWDHRAVATLYGSLQLGINLLAIYVIAPLPTPQQLLVTVLLYLALCLTYFTARHYTLLRPPKPGKA
jgi:UDP-GlcNAc:undecaprenyl-phosphate/decaprenyl-phosphate GlcNAc-1-phosphate transferase